MSKWVPAGSVKGLFVVPAASSNTPLGQVTPSAPSSLPKAPIRYICPRCGKSLESPASMGGQKLNCPGCSQRLQIPPPPMAALNKTMLATEDSNPQAQPLVPSQDSAVRPQPPPLPLQVQQEPAAPRECCRECGRDVTRRERLRSCADCDALFCSSACVRQHRKYAHEGTAPYAPEKSSGIAAILEVLPGLLIQTFGIGHMYAGNVGLGLGFMFGYWFVAFLNILLIFFCGIGLVTGLICWIAMMILSPILASSAASKFNSVRGDGR